MWRRPSHFLIGAFHPIAQFSLRERSKQIHSRSSEFRVDDFRLAVELAGKEDVPSASLRDRFTEQIAERLQQTRASWSAPRWKWKPVLGVAVLCLTLAAGLRAALPLTFPFSSRFMFPFSSAEWQKNIVIEPGDARVAMGGSMNVRVRLSKDFFDAPELFVKTGGAWNAAPANLMRQALILTRLTVSLSPGVVPRTLEKRVERKIHADARRAVGDSRLDAQADDRPPTPASRRANNGAGDPRTGGHADRTQGRHERIAESGVMQFSRREIARCACVLNGKSASFDFVLDRTATYRVALDPSDDMPRAEQDTYAMTVVSDEPPQITMLSPEQDLVIGDNEACPVTFEAKDDVALGHVDLAWQDQTGRTGTQAVKTYGSLARPRSRYL